MNSDLANFRLQTYRHLLLSSEGPDTFQDMTDLWSQTSATVNRLSTLKGTTPEEEAELCLTMLVGLQLGIRNSDSLNRAIDRAFTILPQITDRKLLCHLLVHLYAETEDEELLAEINTLMPSWPRETLTEEDRYLQEFYLSAQENALC